MLKQTLIFASVIVIFAVAIIVNLAILDLLSIQELKESLGKILSIIAVSSAALLLILALVKIGTKRSPDKNNR